MKLQGLMVIFIIIAIPVIILLTYYINLQKETIAMQTTYDSKLITSTKQAIEAFEVNTVEWNEEASRYADSKRRDILASINVFTTSFANSLNLVGTSKENLLTYIPAIMYNLYTGYYIYTPTYVPKVLNDQDGNAVLYDDNNDTIKCSNGVTISNGTVLYICDDSTKADGKYEDIYFTANIDNAVKEYKHTLKTFVPYSEKIDDKDCVINYTLDNYIKIYTKEEAKEGHLINNTIQVIANSVSIEVGGKTIKPEALSENVIYEENNTIIKEKYNYIYNSNNEKCYYDEVEETFFKVKNNKKIYLSSNCQVGDYNCEYRKLLMYDNTSRTYNEYYQVLNGNDKGKWYTKENETWQEFNTISTRTSLPNINEDCSAINYYIEAYVFTKWVNNLDIKHLKTSDTNNPEDENSIFNKHRKEVIKNSIKANLQLAIDSYSRNSNYNYALPIFSEEEWEEICNNVAITTFIQGIPIGLKYYNNYSISTSTKNKEHVNPKEIYYVVDGHSYYHKKNCEKITAGSKEPEIVGYKNIDFALKQITKNEMSYNYFKHEELKCYYCLISDKKEEKYETAYEIAYMHAIARERYIQKK